MTTHQARAIGFSIVPCGTRYFFVDVRSGYTSPVMHERILWDTLEQYIAKHRAPLHIALMSG